MTLVVDASVGLKWVLPEQDAVLADHLRRSDEALVIPDFWLHDATNVLWLQVRRKLLRPSEARSALALLKRALRVTSTTEMALHSAALAIGISTNHSTYDTMYIGFALAVGARGVVVADQAFFTDMLRHDDPGLASIVIPLDAWARDQGLS